MIWALRGKIFKKDSNHIVLDTGNILYDVVMTSKDLEFLNEGQELLVYVREDVKEGEPVELVGFLSEEERYLYDVLTSVNGIGKKNALRIMEVLDLQNFSSAVETKDIKFLSSLPGIGQKTAERIILELSGKIKSSQLNPNLGEAVETLIALGFSRNDAFVAVEKAAVNGKNLEEIVKGALSILRKV
ncbi:Holliday junction branch migration protein RuvA [Athalassotoga saccharophila]|uniref:Holliday junction branch migration protein RuvA n=1 Tax=Athalassotoga saccharophila TaxID=1441386 RepID=UPI00137A9AB4|nr:Holliday junction branch migration protein RuvA [Athalassotoga saccharophila]BBJ28234.1 Holliday junction ATP-dependent DNA helicase RuvA [Athalassotoga saccharophila]